jgi:hypothetical protein
MASHQEDRAGDRSSRTQCPIRMVCAADLPDNTGEFITHTRRAKKMVED